MGSFSSRSVLLRASTTVLGLALFALLAVSLPAGADAAPKPTVKVVTKNQQSLLGANKLKVRVRSVTRATVRVRAASAGRKNLFRGVKVRFKRKGTRVVSLRLTRTGRTALSKCGAKTVVVKATASGRTSRTKKKLARWAKRCAAPVEYVTVPLGENPEICDFLDTTICLQPFANDYYTKADPSSPTGRR